MPKSQKQQTEEQAGFDPAPLELAIIGFIVTQPERFYQVAELREFHFTSPARRKVFATLAALAQEAGEGALGSIALIQSRLVEQGVSQDDTFDILTEAKDHAPDSPAALDPIKAKLIALALRRALAAGAEELSAVATDSTKGADELVDAASEIVVQAVRQATVVQIGSLREELDAEAQRVISGADEEFGYQTGLRALTDKLNGLHGGELIVIGGRPSMGKSSLLNKIIVSLAMDEGVPGCLFSLEMPRKEITQRIICNFAQVNSHKARARAMNEIERSSYLSWAKQLTAAEIFIYDSGSLSAAQINAVTRRLYHESGIGWIAVDYLQLMEHHQHRGESTTEAIGRTSGSLKRLALSLEIPVILLSQLNRDCENRGDNKRPKLMDLRSSGSIEQDADVVVMVYRDDYPGYHDEDWLTSHPEKRGIAELIIPKQRNGPTGTVKVAWKEEWAGFEDLVGESERSQVDLAYVV